LLSAPELAAALGIVLLGSIVMGLAGFGMGMVIAPVLLLFMEPQAVVITVVGLSIPTLGLVRLQSREDVEGRTVIPLTVGGLAALPPAVLVLNSTSPGALRITIAVIILCLAVISILDIRKPLPRNLAMGSVFGFAGSMLTMSLGVGMPIVALFLTNQGLTARAVRASMAAYYLVVATVTFIVYGIIGLLPAERLLLLAEMVPVVLVGFVVASKLVDHTNDRVLRRIVLVVIVASSAALLGRELAGV
jgi:uncharacterized membrane protein YfcA